MDRIIERLDKELQKELLEKARALEFLARYATDVPIGLVIKADDIIRILEPRFPEEKFNPALEFFHVRGDYKGEFIRILDEMYEILEPEPLWELTNV